MNRLKRWKESIWKGTSRLFTLLLRPFIDFYFNYGLSRASVMSYVLCANLIIFVYLLLAFTLSVDAFADSSSLRRFLELHFLWPCPERILVKGAPPGFEIGTRDIVTKERYREALAKYCRKHDVDPKELEESGRLHVENFSITQKLGNSIDEAIRTFQNNRFPLTIGFFVILAIAYIALLLNIKTNLAESVSPLIWGNLPLASRSSEIMKLLWRLPQMATVTQRLSLFFMLPLLVAVAVSLLFTCHKLVDRLIQPYTFLNSTFTVIVSLVITTLLFTGLYKLHVSDISNQYAAVGAFIASALWLGGRWMFTTYGAVSLYLNLGNFAFVPIVLTWFYYLCAVFLFGIYVAHTFENPNLSTIARSWEMRDIAIHHRYTFLAHWVRLDFLYRLAQNRNEESRPPFVGINVKGDTADEIARRTNLSSPFVRECILEMLTRHKNVFVVELEGNRQYCKLRLPPEEVDVIPLITDCGDSEAVMEEMEDYDFGRFILEKHGTFWEVKPILLSDVYRAYRAFQKERQERDGRPGGAWKASE